ncbi:MAG: hypothetical protein CYG59_12120 [Chloroflexi bacterium]|nr:MAG: hypothetical protein CYG59_12120 [Chloroflexota bacterium]
MKHAPLYQTGSARTTRGFHRKRLAFHIAGVVALVIIGANLGRGFVPSMGASSQAPSGATDAGGISHDLIAALKDVRNIPSPALTAPEPDRFIEDTFNSTSSGWLQRKSAKWSADYVDGRYRLVLSGQPSIAITSAHSTDNYRLRVDVAVTEGSAGVVFLAAKPATFYRLLISSDGSYAIQVAQQSPETLSDVVKWTKSAALHQAAGATNRLRIERQGSAIHVFANDQPLADWTIPSGTFISQYGFVLTSATGQGQATFDNLVGERLPSP